MLEELSRAKYCSTYYSSASCYTGIEGILLLLIGSKNQQQMLNRFQHFRDIYRLTYRENKYAHA